MKHKVAYIKLHIWWSIG